jgi:hypothetical protein
MLLASARSGNRMNQSMDDSPQNRQLATNAYDKSEKVLYTRRRLNKQQLLCGALQLSIL